VIAQLKGQVIDCAQTFITLTTHHILSTKISTEKLHQQGFFFNTATLEWSRERDNSSGRQMSGNNCDNDEDNDLDMNDELLGPSTSIYLDDTVEFVVEKIHECGGNVMLDGTMPCWGVGACKFVRGAIVPILSKQYVIQQLCVPS
jgi:hypothetical protein